jgi:NAD(P)H-hydrate epimerase
MTAIDRLAAAGGLSVETLMENAGRQTANEIAKRWPAQRATVLCGPGNNGGDGYVVARHLRARGYDVEVKWVGAETPATPEARAMAQAWQGSSSRLMPEDPPRPGLYVDAILGAGLNRALDAGIIQHLSFVRHEGFPLIAIDVPSGLHGDTARFMGDREWTADLTVTFFRKKPAHVLMPGRDRCGEIVVADIGIPIGLLGALQEAAAEDALAAAPTFENTRPSGLAKRARDAHKYRQGHVVVVSGGPSATGAGRLAARAALRVGAGLVTVACPSDAIVVVGAHLTSEMLCAADDADALARVLQDARKNVVVIGPGNGVGEMTKTKTLAALSSSANVVIDADAITSFASAPSELFAAIRGPAVLTPHEGEFERLFPGLLKSSVNRIEAARLAAAMSGAVIVLKGPDTVIARPKGEARVNINAPPWLATAGSGDVLAGIIAGLIAPGMDAFQASCAAVWLHGALGEALSSGLIAQDLPEMLPAVLETMG